MFQKSNIKAINKCNKYKQGGENLTFFEGCKHHKKPSILRDFWKNENLLIYFVKNHCMKII